MVGVGVGVVPQDRHMHTRPSSSAMFATLPPAATTTKTRTMGVSTRLIRSCQSHKGFLRDLAIGTRPHMDPGAAVAAVQERSTSVVCHRLRPRPRSRPCNSSNNRCLQRRRLLRPRLAHFLHPQSSANWICRLRPPPLMLPIACQQHPRSTLPASIRNAAVICPHSRPSPRPNSCLHRCLSSSSNSSSKSAVEAARRVKSTHRYPRHWALATPTPTALTVHSQPKRPPSRQQVRHVAVAAMTTKRGISGGGS